MGNEKTRRVAPAGPIRNMLRARVSEIAGHEPALRFLRVALPGSDRLAVRQPDAGHGILWAAGDIIENRPPLSPWHPDNADQFAAFLKGGG